MALSKEQKDRISEVIKNILLKRIDNFPDLNMQNRNAPFHDVLLECFKEKFKPLNIEIPYLIAITSWLHGLNTSLGSGFESIAHILSGGYKRKFTGPYKLKTKETQAAHIEKIIRDLKSGDYKPNLERENGLIFNYKDEENEVDALGFTTDNYIERNDEIIAVEIKSVRPNSGEGRGEKQKILYGKAAFKLLHPDKEIRFFIGFPFDPTSKEPTSYDKDKFFSYLIEFKKFFSPEEVLIGSELWDHFSGSKNTMEDILDVITETVLFVKKNK